MLKTSKTVTINGTSLTDNGEIIATMHCSIPTNGAINSSDNISHTLLYEGNIEQVRADIDDFRTYCRQVEDELRVGNVNDETEVETEMEEL